MAMVVVVVADDADDDAAAAADADADAAQTMRMSIMYCFTVPTLIIVIMNLVNFVAIDLMISFLLLSLKQQ